MAFLEVDDELLSRARELTGAMDETALVRRALERLIGIESSRRLARLAGSEPELGLIRRRRWKPRIAM